MTIYRHVWYRTALCVFSQVGGYGSEAPKPLNNRWCVWVWHCNFLLVGLIPHKNPSFGFSQIPLSCEMCFSHSSFSSLCCSTLLPYFSHTGHTFSLFFFFKAGLSVLVIYLKVAQDVFSQLNCVVSLSIKQWHHLSYFIVCTIQRKLCVNCDEPFTLSALFLNTVVYFNGPHLVLDI